MSLFAGSQVFWGASTLSFLTLRLPNPKVDSLLRWRGVKDTFFSLGLCYRAHKKGSLIAVTIQYTIHRWDIVPIDLQ